MTTPDVPHRFELTVEVPGTAEQVWDAIATANGISSWMLRTDLEEHEGGAVCFHMGEADSSGTVTGWDPPRRFAYVEPEWAALAGRADESVTPLATEFLVEAQSGGTCIVRVVSSAFGTGADWEQEFFEEMAKGWTPMFHLLKLYLTHFPGQQVTTLEAQAVLPGTLESVWSIVRTSLDAGDVGESSDVRGLTALVEDVGDQHLLLRVTAPVPGLVAVHAHDAEPGSAVVMIGGYFFSERAADYVAREQPAWAAWLESLAVSST